MYTESTFETLGVFTLMRPVFMTILLISIILFIAVVIPTLREKFLNGLSIIALTIVSILASAQLMYYGGIIVDEIGLAGDPVAFDMFLTIVGLGVINLVVFFRPQMFADGLRKSKER